MHMRFIIICICFALIPSASAQITFSNDQPLIFPKAVIPASGNVMITLNYNGSVDGSSDATVIDTNEQNGEVKITSVHNGNSAPIDIDIGNITTPTGITLDNIEIRYRGSTYNQGDMPVSGINGPGKGGKTISIGGRLRIYDTATEGTQNLSFDLIITENLQ